jgi:aspartate racemase
MKNDVRSRTVGIIGGMGPQATIDLYQKIVQATPAESDQDHLHVIIDSFPQIPDRTKALLYDGEDPSPYLIASAKRLINAGAECIVIPCNTCHAFLPYIEDKIDVPILNMIKATSNFISTEYSEVCKIGLLATSGTIRTGLYQNIFKENNQQILTPNARTQEKLVMNAIYGKDGIKAGNLSEEPRKLLVSAAEELILKGAQVIVGGCTEIPLVLFSNHLTIPFVDPTMILAQNAVSFALKRNVFRSIQIPDKANTTSVSLKGYYITN